MGTPVMRRGKGEMGGGSYLWFLDLIKDSVSPVKTLAGTRDV